MVSRIPIGQEPPSTEPGKSRIIPLALCIMSVHNSRIRSSKRALVLRVHALLCTVTHIARLLLRNVLAYVVTRTQ